MADNEYSNAILRRLQDKIFAFMDDVRRQTHIFEGRRSVEEQLSGEYHGRFLIELIQNADDACGQDGKILIVIRENPPRIVVFNTGKGFTSRNFESLCTLGLTDKKPEEAIGNKGLGFRSVLEVCNTPIIYSSNINRSEGTLPCFDGYCFRFDPDELTNALHGAAGKISSNGDISPIEIAGRTFHLLESSQPHSVNSLRESLKDPAIFERVCKTIPAYEMPVPTTPSDGLLLWAGKQGAATGVFLEIKPGLEAIFRKALGELNATTFLFLRNARHILVYMETSDHAEPDRVIEFERIIPRLEDKAEIRKGEVKVKFYDKAAWAAICGKDDISDDSQAWWFYRRIIPRSEFEQALEGLPERWREIKQIEVEIAIHLGTENEVGRFAIYLPTQAKTGTGAWVNAPFYGKIDRTSIDWGRPWNFSLLNHAVACVGEMVGVVRQSPDIESGRAILRLLGITDKGGKLAEAQISSEIIQGIVKEERWGLSEPNSEGKLHYEKLSALTLPEDLSWKVKPDEPVMDIICREKVSLIFPNPELDEEVIKNTTEIYGAKTKKPTDEELALLAETAIRGTDNNKRTSTWWNNLYRWLGNIDISYDALIGKRLIWTQAGISKVEQDSRIFTPPRRLVASEEEGNPMIKRFQEVLINSLPAALQDRIAFLQPEIDLTDKDIQSLLIRRYGGTVVREFRTEQVADFILTHICPELYREKMSKNRRRDAAEIFAWTFILWSQMRGERADVDWSQLLIPTTTGWRRASETYAGKAWTGDEGADLEAVFQNASPPKPFLTHPKNLIQMLPKIFQDLFAEYDLKDDLTEFILDALKVWTAPQIIVEKATRRGAYLPEFCPTGFFNSLNTTPIRDMPDKYKLPIDKEIWAKYLQRIEQESQGKPFQMSAKYLLTEIAYIEEIRIRGPEPEAMARCLGRGWEKYYKHHAKATIRRHPQDSGESRQWTVSGFVIEQLASTKWIPMRVWATKAGEASEVSKEFIASVAPRDAIKVNKDLLEAGSALIYSLLPHISPNVEQDISEDFCKKTGIFIYSPRQREVENPFRIMQLLYQAHGSFPSGREHLLLSLWQDMFDAAVARFGSDKILMDMPLAALGFGVQKGGGRRFCWLKPVGEENESQPYTVWVNDNEDSLSMLPPETLIACSGKVKTRPDDRITILKHILQKVDVRRLSELKTIPEFDPVQGWETPRLLSDEFPWLILPALAVLAFGRQPSPPMSVSNPKGEFPPLAAKLQSLRVQYVRNLQIRLKGMDVRPQPRNLYYYSSEKLLLLNLDAELRLRNLAAPLSIVFEREDYQNPAQLWLREVEEATEDKSLRKNVASEVAIDALDIESTSLQELFQVIGGQTQQIIRSVAPALFALIKKSPSPIPAQEFNSTISRIADSGKPYDLAEERMGNILAKSGVSDALKYSQILREIAEQRRESAEIAKTVCKQIGIDLGDWNSAAHEIGARGQVVSNLEGAEAFTKVKHDTRWAACGFLQIHLQDSHRGEFRKRWESYDELKPSDSIHQTWLPSSAQIEQPVIQWFESQSTDLLIRPDFLDKDKSEKLSFIRERYAEIAKDPDAVLDDNIKALNILWARLRIVLASLAMKTLDSDAILSSLQSVDKGAPGKWASDNEHLQSELSVARCSGEASFALLCDWLNSSAVLLKRFIDGTKAKTLDEFIRNKGIRSEDEQKAEDRLAKGPSTGTRQNIAHKPLEVPEKESPLDDLRKNLDEVLKENNQEILKQLAGQVDIEKSSQLGEPPPASHKKRTEKKKPSVYKEKDRDFIGYVGEYLVFRALKKRYPHIGLSNWVSGNKQKFFPGSAGDDTLGYDFCIPVSGRRVLIEVKSHTGDQSYFELGSSELNAAQEALDTGDIYQIWVVRNLEGNLEIDHILNPMEKENRKHFRFEVGRVYYQTE